MAHDVFISYSDEDKAVANKVLKGLESRGIDCWIAWRDAGYGPFAASIMRAIESSKVMVVILSGNANQSKWVALEVQNAVQNDVVIIPFRVENIDPIGAIAFLIRAANWVEALEPPIEEHIEKLSSWIKVVLGPEPPPEPKPSDEEEEEEDLGRASPRRRWSMVFVGSVLGLLVLVAAGILIAAHWTGRAPAVAPASPTAAALPTTPVETRVPPATTVAVDPTIPTPTSAQVLPASAELGDRWTRPVDGMEMVYVPAGSFEMGSEKESSEMPVRMVTLDEFWLDRTEVTSAQYLECVAAGACMPSEFADGTARNPRTDLPLHAPEQPVVGVSWFSAVAYCEWVGARLPTEAEWEYAARGPEGWEYPWGDENPTCDLANYSYLRGTFYTVVRDCVGASAPVGSYPDGASWVGALDMAGNVKEWVADWYGEYPEMSEANPIGPDIGERRVVRSVAWYNVDTNGGLRSARRSSMNPTSTGDHGTGIRCASSQKP